MVSPYLWALLCSLPLPKVWRRLLVSHLWEATCLFSSLCYRTWSEKMGAAPSRKWDQHSEAMFGISPALPLIQKLRFKFWFTWSVSQIVGTYSLQECYSCYSYMAGCRGIVDAVDFRAWWELLMAFTLTVVRTQERRAMAFAGVNCLGLHGRDGRNCCCMKVHCIFEILLHTQFGNVVTGGSRGEFKGENNVSEWFVSRKSQKLPWFHPKWQVIVISNWKNETV